MPNINIDDVYILNETGAEVDKVTGLYSKNENASDTEKAQARANIGAGGTNPNLLDNAYFVGGGSQLGDGIFPINQRGQTSYAAYANSIDRWYAAAAMTIEADGLSCGAIVQKLSQTATLDGKPLTFSALLADGTMLSGSAVFNSASDIYFYNDAGASEYLIYNTYFGGFEVVTTRKLAAVKLEYGTVSTLANDAPPDYGEELAKCLRYLFVLDIPAYFYIGCYAVAGDGTHGTFVVHTPVNMASPVITASIQGSLVVSTQGTIASIQWATAFSNAVNIAFALSSGSMVNGVMYPLQTSTATKLILSCEP